MDTTGLREDACAECGRAIYHVLPEGEGGSVSPVTLCISCRKLVKPEKGDWRTWVYGGARNPIHDI